MRDSGASTLLPNGTAMRNVLVCDDCDADVHLACSGFKNSRVGLTNAFAGVVVAPWCRSRFMTAKTTTETTVMVTLDLTTTLTRDEEWR